jgi:predicted Holliday junction resolvase-like endonuclease
MGILAVMLLVLAIGFFTVVVTLIADAIIGLYRTVDTQRTDWLERRRQYRRQQQITEDALRFQRQKELRQDVRSALSRGQDDQRQRLEAAARLGQRP